MSVASDEWVEPMAEQPHLVSASEPTADEIREYRLDAVDPEMRRLNWQEWRAHIGEPDACPHCQYPLSEHGGAEPHMHREEPCDCEPICPIPPRVAPTSDGSDG